jgi:hypothetical protein
MFQFILAALFVELTPGPNMAYLATLALARGRAAGLFAIIGVAFGLTVHAAVASFGAGQLLLLYPWLYEILRWIGVMYLLFLAWEGWLTKEKSPGTADLNSTLADASRIFIERVQSEVRAFLRFRCSNIRRNGAGPSKFPLANGDVGVGLGRHSHSSAYSNCDVGCRAKALAGRGTTPKCGPAGIGNCSRVRGRLAVVGDKTLGPISQHSGRLCALKILQFF